MTDERLLFGPFGPFNEIRAQEGGNRYQHFGLLRLGISYVNSRVCLEVLTMYHVTPEDIVLLSLYSS